MSSVSFMEKLLDGVEIEWKTLGDLCKIETGKLNANAAVDGGEYMFFTTAKEASRIDSYRWDTEALLVAGNANVGEVKHYIGKFDAYQRTYVLTNFNLNIDARFIFFVLCNSLKKYLEEKTNRAAMTYIVLSTLQGFQIPIPCPDNPKKSLEIQAEIVRILDSFTEFTAELTAELGMRKKQFNYYRDMLLTFDEGEVEWKALGELTIDRFWIMPATPKFNENETIPYITSKNIKGGHIDFNKVKFISKEDYLDISRNRPILAGDFLISMIGTIGEIAMVKNSDLNFYGQNMYLIRLNENLIHSRYFLHFFDSPKMKSHFHTVKNNSGQGYLKANNIEGLRVPVPSMSQQARIVAILDKFDALTNSTSEGLPREIELRQKQYEYYRDLLLSFPKPEGKAA
jgi:type I restriction enzyme S subunit